MSFTGQFYAVADPAGGGGATGARPLKLLIDYFFPFSFIYECITITLRKHGRASKILELPVPWSGPSVNLGRIKGIPRSWCALHIFCPPPPYSKILVPPLLHEDVTMELDLLFSDYTKILKCIVMFCFISFCFVLCCIYLLPNYSRITRFDIECMTMMMNINFDQGWPSLRTISKNNNMRLYITHIEKTS